MRKLFAVGNAIASYRSRVDGSEQKNRNDASHEFLSFSSTIFHFKPPTIKMIRGQWRRLCNPTVILCRTPHHHDEQRWRSLAGDGFRRVGSGNRVACRQEDCGREACADSTFKPSALPKADSTFNAAAAHGRQLACASPGTDRDYAGYAANHRCRHAKSHAFWQTSRSMQVYCERALVTMSEQRP